MKDLKRHSKREVQEVVRMLSDRFEYIGRYEAIKFIKEMDSTIQIKTINIAYTNVEKFHY